MPWERSTAASAGVGAGAGVRAGGAPGSVVSADPVEGAAEAVSPPGGRGVRDERDRLRRFRDDALLDRVENLDGHGRDRDRPLRGRNEHPAPLGRGLRVPEVRGVGLRARRVDLDSRDLEVRRLGRRPEVSGPREADLERHGVPRRDARPVETGREVETAHRPAEVGPAGNRENPERDRLGDEVHHLGARKESERVSERVGTHADARADLRLRNGDGAGRQPRHDLLQEREAHDGLPVHDVAAALGPLRLFEVLGPEPGELGGVEVLEALDVGLGQELVRQRDLLADEGRRLVGRDAIFDERAGTALPARALGGDVAPTEELGKRVLGLLLLLGRRAARRPRAAPRPPRGGSSRPWPSCRRTRTSSRRSRRARGREAGART